MSDGHEFFLRSAMGIGRSENQDRCIASHLDKGAFLLAVADGLGGHAGGGLAADTALRCLERRLAAGAEGEWNLAGNLLAAGEEVSSLAASDHLLEGLGTTLTVLVLEGSMAFWAHAGDSRLYLLRDGVLAQVSRDHRFLQDLLDSGDVTPQELAGHPLRNVLDQCVGCPGLTPEHGHFRLREEDVLLLSTDGVHDYVEPEAIRDALSSFQDPGAACEALIDAARCSGSTDDASLVLCRIGLRSCRGIQ